jgi:hypothetical protein
MSSSDMVSGTPWDWIMGGVGVDDASTHVRVWVTPFSTAVKQIYYFWQKIQPLW